MKSKLAIALLLTGLLSIGAWSSYAQASKSTSVKYEYAVIDDPTVMLTHDEGVQVGVRISRLSVLSAIDQTTGKTLSYPS